MGLGQPIEIAFYENRTQHCSHTSGISKSIRPSPGHVRRNTDPGEPGDSGAEAPGAAGPARSAHHEQIRHRYLHSTTIASGADDGSRALTSQCASVASRGSGSALCAAHRPM